MNKRTSTKPRGAAKKLRAVAATPRKRRVLVRDSDGARLVSTLTRHRELCKIGPTLAAVEWVERHADGFDRLALLIDAADEMYDRRNIDPDAANHVAISFSMMRNELRGLRKRLSP